MTIDTLLSPAELPALAHRDLRGTACVVFDILRATSTFVTALHHGAAAIIPVNDIPTALVLRRQRPEVRLAGERDGVRIAAALTGGVAFDFGNSPREFTPERVRGQTIVSTTTNGTRALRAGAAAKTVLAASFLNLAATADYLRGEKELLLICAGTGEHMASEDINAAGAMIELLITGQKERPKLSANAFVAQKAYAVSSEHFPNALRDSENGRRLLAIPELRDDVAFCARRDVFNLVAVLHADGALRKV